MGNYKSDLEVDGQLSIDDIFSPPERLFAVSNVFARARKSMTLDEQKAFVYALSEMQFTEEAKSDCVKLDKKVLANILGIHSDTNHLSQDLYNELKDLPRHSYIEIAERDADYYSSGIVITAITKFKNILRLRFNREYLPLFTNLSSSYITMWSADIFRMTSRRSVQFYELLRQLSYPANHSDGNGNVYSYGWGIKAIKEMFDIPKDAYMRTKGGFNRSAFEAKVLDPLCDDLMQCRMIQLVMQPDGKPYEKVKRGNRVSHYQFYWTLSMHPAVATASEVKEITDRIDKDPQVLRIARDIVHGEKRPQQKAKSNSFTDFEQRKYDFDALEKLLTLKSTPPTTEEPD